jgi:hypothetical protein
MKGAFCWAI